MNFGIIGEPCIDYIHRKECKPVRHLGGILYSVITLSFISSRDDIIYPVMYLGEDEYENITGILSEYPNVRFNYIFKTPHKTRVVNLYYNGNCTGFGTKQKVKTYDREESSTEPAASISFEQTESLIPNLDALLVNMISGSDISLNTLQKISDIFTGYIHLDLHNVVMKTLPDGQRIQSTVDDWEKWCKAPDTLQMNESENFAVTGGVLSEYETAEKILSPPETKDAGRVKAMIITRGKGGVSLFRKVRKSYSSETFTEIDKSDIPAIERNDFKDSTGCGDVFSTGFFYKNAVAKSKDYFAAMLFANKMASRNSALQGAEELSKILEND
jgi:hypothetical protein